VSILVTGGCGVIGSWVVRTLLEAGERPVVFDAREDRGLLGPAAGEVPVHTGDCRDLERLERVARAERVTRIAHLAAIMPDTATADPYLGFSVNVAGTLNALEVGRRLGVQRLVFTSSKAALGPLSAPYVHPTYAPVPDTLAPEPADVYGVSKRCCEEVGRCFAAGCGLTFVVLRLASTYGPGKTARHGRVGILSRIIEGAVRGESVRIPRGADQQNDFLYCRDIAQAVVRSLSARVEGPRLFQIGSGRLASLADFVAALREEVPGCDVEVGPGLDYSGLGVGHYFRFDIEPARRELGFEPQFDVRRGVADYVRLLRG
jgi:UDP-glucose 4-epimerase